MQTEDDYRRQEIRELAEGIAFDYFPEGLIKPEVIAAANDITYSYGHYEDCFDGLLQYERGHFHIFLNLDRNSDPERPRMRYTQAHELGHFFIDEHRNAIRAGRVRQHPSFNPPNTRNAAEKEADYFASCLLMPERKVRSFCYKKPLTGNLITDMSKHFKVSVTACLYKYLELSLFPMTIVMSENGKIKWSRHTTDFKYWLIPKTGTPLPPNTAAAEFFTKNRQYKTEEIVFADDWFLDQFRIKEEQFWEKCFYLPKNRILSLIWKKEKRRSFTY